MIVGTLAGCGVLTSLQFTFIVPVLPLIPELLSTRAADASWLVTITLLVGVVGTPVMTRLADTHGRRRMLLASMALLVIGSLIAIVPVFPAVLVGRALQGFGTAVVPIGIALLSSLVSRRRATIGIALMSGTLGIGSTLGLTLAGPLVEWGGLAAIFVCTALIGAFFCALVRMRIPEPPVRRGATLDALGALLLAIGLTPLLLVISRGHEWGWTSVHTLVLLAVAALALPVWLRWERRHPRPLIDVRTAMRSPIAPINVASFFATFGMYANHLLTSQEALAPAATGYGLTMPPAAAGLFLAPSALAMIALAPVAARVINRFGGRIALMAGAGIMTAAFALRIVLHDDPTSVAIGSALVGVGVAFAFAAMPSLITAATPREDVAAANGINSVVRTFSGGVAAAMFAFAISVAPAEADAAFLSHLALRVSFAFTALCGLTTVIIAALIRLPRHKELA
ncbi:MFS transporter [Microbacterium sp. MC2]